MTSSKKSGEASEPDGVRIGTLVGPFGLQGEVKLYPLTHFPERIPELESLQIRRPGAGEAETRRLLTARPHGRLYVVRLEGCATANDAEALRDAEVWVEMERAVPPPPGQYWVHQIIGLKVVTLAGEELGTVREVMHTGANDVYRTDDLLIPATREAVLEIDLERGVLVVPSREYLTGEAALPGAEGGDGQGKSKT